MKASVASDLLEVLTHYAVGKEGSQLDHLKSLANALRDEIANAEEDDEPESYSTTVTAKDLALKLKEPDHSYGEDCPTCRDVYPNGKCVLVRWPGSQPLIEELNKWPTLHDVTRSLAEDHRVFVVEEAVPAGSLPPDELVFRKAQE